jgi:ribosomal-protein-alanine N-acetyltransferase
MPRVSGGRTPPDERLLSPRLQLIALPGAVVDEVIGKGRRAFLEHVGVGYPAGWPSQDRHMLELRRRQISEGADYRWLLRAVVTRNQPEMVGRIGFHGPPDVDGVVEIGYRIDAAHRRRGFGLESARQLIESAERLGQIWAVRASIAPANEPSLRIAARLGFQRVGERMDEIDGLELVFERRLTRRLRRARSRQPGTGASAGARRRPAAPEP